MSSGPEERRPLSLTDDYPASRETGGTSIDASPQGQSRRTIPPQADASRVLLGREPARPGLGPGAGMVPMSTSVYDITRKDSSGWLTNLEANNPQDYNAFVGLLRASGFLGPRASSKESIRDATDRAAKQAAARYAAGQTEDVDLIDYLFSRVEGPGTDMGGGGRSGRAAAYTGPRTSVTLASERDLRNTADAIASTVLGRGITDEEFQSVLEKVRTAERAEAQVTTGGTAMTTTQAGLSAEGRQDVITRALMQGPEAEEFGRATKMMDLFYSALEARPEGA